MDQHSFMVVKQNLGCFKITSVTICSHTYCTRYLTHYSYLCQMYLFKASMTNIPYDPILHDLSISPRNMTSAEIVQYWLGDLSLFLSKITGWKFQICFSSRMLHNGTKLSKLLIFPACSSHFLAYLATFWCWSLVTTQLWQLQSPSWVKIFSQDTWH